MDAFTNNDADLIKRAEEIAQRLGQGMHLDHWREIASGLAAGRRACMRRSNSNSPQGRRYGEAWADWLSARPHLQALGNDSLKACLWVFDGGEHIAILDEILSSMSPEQRSRLTSPIAARQRVAAVLKARTGDASPGRKNSDAAGLRAEIARLRQQVADLQSQNAKLRQGGGTLTKAQFRQVMLCLHPDTGANASPADRTRAAQILNDHVVVA